MHVSIDIVNLKIVFSQNHGAAVLQYVILHIRACGSGREVMALHHNVVVVVTAATIGAAKTAT